MTVDSATPRSRRAILAASVGGAAAFVANALSRATPASAADGQTMVVGGEYSASSKTFLGISANDYAFWGASDINIGVVGTSGSSSGVQGESNSGTGVYGYGGTSGVGVRGDSPGSFGVWGSSANNYGVYGTTSFPGPAIKGTGLSGVEGEATSGWGVYGHSSSSVGVKAASDTGTGIDVTVGADASGISSQVGPNLVVRPAKTAVYGRSVVDSGSRGVTGETTNGRGVNGIASNGRGVHGQASSGRGVHGQATSGRGVYGFATTGTAGYFERDAGATGTALRAVGPVKLDNCAGVATVASGTNTVAVTPGIDLTASSAVVATLMGDAGGSTVVKRVSVNASTNVLTIILSANSTKNVKVAWHVFN
ncbi:MAG TPA: hypothetical protein VFV72_16980 [Candidatus Limnocylindrales bacterium]|nr:hypothetical protein [Candidatus Limnocylindrales bacterium]